MKSTLNSHSNMCTVIALAFLFNHFASAYSIVYEEELRSRPVEERNVSLANSSTQTAALGCGGIVNLPPQGQFALLDYKSTQAYAVNEQCVWTLNGLNGTKRQQATLKVTLVVDGLQSCCDKVTFHSLNRASDITSQPLASLVPVSTTAEWHFLSFASDGNGVSGTGFIVKVEVLALRNSFDAFIQLSSPTFSSGSYSKAFTNLYAHVLILVSPQSKPMSFTVNTVDIRVDDACAQNNLQVYEMNPVGTFTRRTKLCGKFSTSPASFKTTYPVIALFGVDSAGFQNAAFRVTWA